MLQKVPHGEEKGGLKSGTRDCKHLISALVHISVVKGFRRQDENGGEDRDLCHTHSLRSVFLHRRSDNFYLMPFKLYILSLH